MLLAAVGLAAPAMADVWSWNAGNGNWMTASNWSPGSVPGTDISVFTTVRIGNIFGVQNRTVLLNQLAPLTLRFGELQLSNGNTLDTNFRAIEGFNGVTELAGGSQLVVRASAGLQSFDFVTRGMSMEPGTLLNLSEGGRFRARSLYSSGVIFGRGTLSIQGSGATSGLTNNGTLSGSGNGGLTVVQESAAPLDLDGMPAESVEYGQLLLASPFSQLTVQGDALADSFSGLVTMGSGSLLNMNLADGWTADANSTFNVSSSIAGAAAQIDGGHFTFGGDLNIGGSQGHLRVLANSTLTNTADVFLGTEDRLELDGATVVDGGIFTLAGGPAAGCRIDFDGPTTMRGGTFNMASTNITGGHVELNGATTWDGNVTINGFARQNGDATVAGQTVINADRFVMDGGGGTGDNTAWQVNNSLVVNARLIGLSNNFFNGTMNIAGGALGRLTINLDESEEAWRMDGVMNLSGAGALPVTRVAGSRMTVGGALNVTGGIVQITADAAFSSPLSVPSVSIANGATLRMRGNTDVFAQTEFNGSGTLQNGVDGTMLLRSGVSLGQVGLTNNAILRIGQSGPGIASVDRFLSTATASWGVDIGGYLAGTNHDLLLVTGGSAMLNGELIVSLLPGFAPLIGDEFTILSSLGGVSGAFSNDPTSFANGLTYDWTVVYNPNSVVLRLDNIVPTPGSLALLGLGGLLAVRRRRTL